VKSPFLASVVNDMCSKELQNKEIPQPWTSSLDGVVANYPVHSRWYLLTSDTDFCDEEVEDSILSVVILSPSLASINDICSLVSCRIIGLVRPNGVSEWSYNQNPIFTADGTCAYTYVMKSEHFMISRWWFPFFDLSSMAFAYTTSNGSASLVQVSQR
jgi:hypothetical protein